MWPVLLNSRRAMCKSFQSLFMLSLVCLLTIVLTCCQLGVLGSPGFRERLAPVPALRFTGSPGSWLTVTGIMSSPDILTPCGPIPCLGLWHFAPRLITWGLAHSHLTHIHQPLPGSDSDQLTPPAHTDLAELWLFPAWPHRAALSSEWSSLG